jgi:hydrogenase nickel incorporation protein HypA/HybF
MKCWRRRTAPPVHELSVCQALIAQVEQVAAEHGARGVKSVRVLIGPLSGVEPQLLADAYDIASAGSVAAGSALVLDPAPLKVRCQTCGAETEAVPNRLLCGQCGDYHTQLISGDELLLASMELFT